MARPKSLRNIDTFRKNFIKDEALESVPVWDSSLISWYFYLETAASDNTANPTQLSGIENNYNKRK
jgi:hypothetical protein